MAQALLGNGEDDREELVRRIENLEQDLEDARAATKRAREQSVAATRALGNLRRQLDPLHKALRAIFGELDAANIESSESNDSQSSVSPRSAQVWESWKQRFGGGTAKVIDALLLHKEMNTTQLSIATGLHRTTIPALIFKLNKASLINKNGGKFSLKEL